MKLRKHNKHHLPLIFLFILSLATCLTTFLSFKPQITNPHANTISSDPIAKWRPTNQLIADHIIPKPIDSIMLSFLYTLSTHHLTTQSLQHISSPPSHIQHGNYSIELLDNTNTILSTTNFGIPPAINTSDTFGKHKTSKTIIPQQIQFTLIIPLTENATKVIVYDENHNQISTSPLSNIASPQIKPAVVLSKSITGDDYLKSIGKPIPTNPNPSIKKINIVYLDQYMASAAAKTKYHNMVDYGIRGFLRTEPLHTRASQFVFHMLDVTEDFNCDFINPNLTNPCNDTIITQTIAQAGIAADAKVIILGNISQELGSTLFENNTVYLNDDDLTQYDPPGMLGLNDGMGDAHELAHAIAYLLDEYDTIHYTGGEDPQDNQLHTNCWGGNPPAPAWQGKVEMYEYSKICSSVNWYKAGAISIMQGGGTVSWLNNISQEIYNARIDAIAGKFTADKTPPTCSIAKTSPTNATLTTSDNFGVDWVKIYADNTPFSTQYAGDIFVDENHPYTPLPTPIIFDGTFSITIPANTKVLMAKVYDASGNLCNTTLNLNTTTTNPTQPPSSGTTPLQVYLHGIGNGGDNANPASISTTTPQHPTRTIQLTILNANGQQIAQPSGSLTYDQTSGSFRGTINPGISQPGAYIAKAKVPGYLSKQYTGIIQYTPSQPFALPEIRLTTGDITNDNKLDILDYNALISCFGSKLATCQNQQYVDLTDDGTVDGIDYNLFLRELSVQTGQ